MKRFIGVLTVCMFLCGVSLMANPKIMREHKGLKKDGKGINCAYCHGSSSKPGLIQKKKGLGYHKGQKKYKSLSGQKSCAGSGCHK